MERRVLSKDASWDFGRLPLSDLESREGAVRAVVMRRQESDSLLVTGLASVQHVWEHTFVKRAKENHFLDSTEHLETCPTGMIASNSQPVNNLRFNGTSLELDLKTLAVITKEIEFDVTEERGPWTVHRIGELDVSACDYEMDPFLQLDHLKELDSVYSLLAIRAVDAARAIVEQSTRVSEQTLAVAIRVIALDHAGELSDTLEALSMVEDDLESDFYAS